MNEINLANIAQDVTPETGNAPKGFVQAINRMNDCKYEFTLRMQQWVFEHQLKPLLLIK